MKKNFCEPLKILPKLPKFLSERLIEYFIIEEVFQKKTEAKIKKLIEEAVFTPNLIARNLVLNKEYKVALLIPSYDTRSPFRKLPKKGIKKG